MSAKGSHADGKIYISAEIIDNFKELASQVKGGLDSVAKEAKLTIEVEDDSVKANMENILKGINSLLKKNKIKKIDLSNIIVPFNDLLSDENILGKEKLTVSSSLYDILFEIDNITNKIHQTFLENLNGKEVQNYMYDLNNAMQFLVENFASNYSTLLNTVLDEKGINVDKIFNLKKLTENKDYGYLVEEYFGNPEDLKKELIEIYKDFNSDKALDWTTNVYKEQLKKMAGLKRSLELATGESLSDIFSNKESDKEMVKNIINFTKKDVQSFGTEFEKEVKDMQKQLLHMYADSEENLENIFADTSGHISGKYNLKSILGAESFQNGFLKKIFDRKIKPSKKINTSDVVDMSVDVSGSNRTRSKDAVASYNDEIVAAENLRQKIKDVQTAIEDKTLSLDDEAEKMTDVVDSEIADLDRLKLKINNLGKQDYSHTGVMTDEKGEPYTIYRLVANAAFALQSEKAVYGGSSFTNTNPDMFKGIKKKNHKVYMGQFKANNPLVLDAGGAEFGEIPKHILEKYTAKTKTLKRIKEKEIQEFKNNLSGEISTWNSIFGTNFALYGNDVVNDTNGDVLDTSVDYKKYLDGIIEDGERKKDIINNITKQALKNTKELKRKEKQLSDIIKADVFPHWEDIEKQYKDEKNNTFNNDGLAAWLQTQDVYDAIILQNVKDIPEKGGNWVEGHNVILKDITNQMTNISLFSGGGENALLQTVEEQATDIYDKILNKIDAIASKWSAISMPIAVKPELKIGNPVESEEEILEETEKDFGAILDKYVDSLYNLIDASSSTKEALNLAQKHFGGKTFLSNEGFSNKGIYQNKDITAIVRDNDYIPKIESLIKPLDDAYNAGANVAKILTYIEDLNNDTVWEIQNTAIGKTIGGKDDDLEWLEATDEQILKLIEDMKIFQKTGLYFDTGGKNLLYDKGKGFSFIDMATKSKEYTTNEPYALIPYLTQYGDTSEHFHEKFRRMMRVSEGIDSITKKFHQGLITEAESDKLIEELKKKFGIVPIKSKKEEKKSPSKFDISTESSEAASYITLPNTPVFTQETITLTENEKNALEKLDEVAKNSALSIQSMADANSNFANGVDTVIEKVHDEVGAFESFSSSKVAYSDAMDSKGDEVWEEVDWKEVDPDEFEEPIDKEELIDEVEEKVSDFHKATEEIVEAFEKLADVAYGDMTEEEENAYFKVQEAIQESMNKLNHPDSDDFFGSMVESMGSVEWFPTEDELFKKDIVNTIYDGADYTVIAKNIETLEEMAKTISLVYEAIGKGIKLAKPLGFAGGNDYAETWGTFFEIDKSLQSTKISKDFPLHAFDATDEQIQKLIEDLYTLKEIGLYFDTNTSNLFFDDVDGFQFSNLTSKPNLNTLDDDPALIYDYIIDLFDEYKDVNEGIVPDDVYEKMNNFASVILKAGAEIEKKASKSEKEKSAFDPEEIAKCFSGIGAKILDADEIAGVMSGGKEGVDPWAKATETAIEETIKEEKKKHKKHKEKDIDSSPIFEMIPKGMADVEEIVEEETSDEAIEGIEEETKKLEDLKDSAITTAVAKDDVTEANKNLSEVTDKTILSLDNESGAFLDLSKTAVVAREAKENLALAEDTLKIATDNTKESLSNEGVFFKSIVEDALDAAESINKVSEANNNFNKIDNNAPSFENKTNNQKTTGIINKGISPYKRLEKIPNDEIIENYENIGGALSKTINRNLKGAINNLDSPSYEDLLEEGYEQLKQDAIDAFNNMSSDGLLGNYSNILGENLSQSISLGLKQGIDNIDWDSSADQLLSDLYQEQKEIEEAEQRLKDNIASVEDQYDKLTDKKSFYTSSDTSVFDLKDYIDKGIDPKGRISEIEKLTEEAKNLKKELSNAFEDGKIKSNKNGIVDEQQVEHVQNLINKYNELIQKITQLKGKIKAKDSLENTQLSIAKTADVINKNIVNGNYDNNINDYQKFVDKYSYYDTSGNLVGKTAEGINKLKEALEEYKKITKDLENAKTDEELVNLGEKAVETENKIKGLVNEIKNLSSPTATETQIKGLAKQIGTFINNNSRLSSDARNELIQYFNLLTSGASIGSDALQKISNRFKDISISEKEAGNLGGNFFDRMIGKAQEGLAYLGTKFSFFEIFNQFKQGIEMVHQFDDALTEMQKVSDETIYSLQRYQKTTFDTASAIGSSALQIQQSTADWMRLGETLTEASKSAKASTILMNVSEFQSIDDATESLVAMGQAYDDLTKMDIIDKLNIVGNNFAISTSEAASALQRSASALKVAGNDMNEALAIVTAGNAVIQNPEQVGLAARTIALRLTGTKSSKEQLEELGEETDSMLTTQSKLRETIKEATSVASNNWKGIDIFDSNGNYKSTYQILLEIANVYEEIEETDKRLGRNNKNLLLETLAGKTRANVAASIISNPKLLREAYTMSQNAEGSAMEENEKYMASISGHMAQLSNAWQELWANTASRDVINLFVDLAKGAVDAANAIGLIPTVLGLITTYMSIIQVGSGKGIFSALLKDLAAFSAIDEITVDLDEFGYVIGEELPDAFQNTNKSVSTVIDKFKLLKEAGVGAWKAITSSMGTMIGAGIATAAIVAGLVYANYKKQREEAIQDAKESATLWNDKDNSLEKLTEEYTKLKQKLDSNTLSEQETYETKQKILDIQKEINENYHTQSSNISLINGELETQLNIIKQISKEEADREYSKNSKGYKAALEEYNQNRAYSIFEGSIDNETIFELQKLFGEKYGLEVLSSTGLDRVELGISKKAPEAINNLYDMRKALIELRDSVQDENEELKYNNIINTIDSQITKAKTTIDDFEETALTGLRLGLFSGAIKSTDVQLGTGNNLRTVKGADILSQYEDAYSQYEDALLLGTTNEIRKAQKAFQEATVAKDKFLSVEQNQTFSLLFDRLDVDILNVKQNSVDALEVLKAISDTYDDENIKIKKLGKTTDKYLENTSDIYSNINKSSNKYAKQIDKIKDYVIKLKSQGLDRIDVEGAFDSDAIEDFEGTLTSLMHMLGYTENEQASFIDLLVDSNIITGSVADVTDNASEAYSQFSQEIANAIENVSVLNGVLSESVSGSNISTQNLDKFKEMFGDDYVYALERSANGYHINAERLQVLTDKQKALMNTNYQKTLDEQYDALKRCNDEIIRMNDVGQNTDGLLSQRAGILQRIQDTKDLMMAYEASTSVYQTWLNAQSNGNEYDMYDKIASGYEAVKDLIDRGWSGDDTVRSYLDLIYGSSFDAWTASGEELVEMFDKLDKKIEGTSFSVRDFFQVDKNNKLTSNGIFNFFDAVEAKQKELGTDWIKDDGTYDFGLGRDREVAEALGLDVEFIQSILRAAVAAGFKVNLDQPIWEMDELKEKAVEAQEELDGFNNINFDELYRNLDSEDAYNNISGYIDDVYDYIQKIENSDLSPEIKTEQIENAQNILSYLVALEREAADRGDIDLKMSVVGKAVDDIKQLTNEIDDIPEELKNYDWDSIVERGGLQKAINYIESLKDSGAIDTSTAQMFLSLLQQAYDELVLIDNYEASPSFGNTVGAYTEAKQAKEDLANYLEIVKEAQANGIHIDFINDSTLNQLLPLLTERNPEIKVALGMNVDVDSETILDMLENGETDIDILLQGDTSQLEKDIKKSTQQSPTIKTDEIKTSTTKTITEESTYLAIDDNEYNQKMDDAAQRGEEFEESPIEATITAQDDELVIKAEHDKEILEDLGKKESEPKINVKSNAESMADSAKTAINSVTGKNVDITVNVFENGLNTVKEKIQNLINKARELANQPNINVSSDTNISSSGRGKVDGTAFVKGTVVYGNAYNSGKWGIAQNQTALTGELGTEIVVRDGNWFTVGDKGAEFVQLKKGDIVFNHKQAEELLRNGYVTSNRGRGSLVGFANGSAFSNGTKVGATRARVDTHAIGSNSSNNSSNNNKGNNNSNKNNSSDKAKETKNTLDEVEILIARIERQISRLDTQIGNTYSTWTKRNQGISRSLEKVTEEIEDQKGAYNTYIKKANSIGLSETWVKKIQSGKLAIEDVNDSDAWDKIQKYKEYYEKALAAQDKLLELEQKQGELYKQRFDNEQAYYEANIEQIQHVIDLNGAYIDKLSEAGYLISKSFASTQAYKEEQRLIELNKEYEKLRKVRDNAVKAGTIKKGSEAWNEMTSAINEVSSAIEEAEQNIISFTNAMREVDWNRWDKTHEAISGIVNELEFLYDLIDEDKMFDEQGNITDYGVTAYALLAQQYDTYIAQANEYAKQRKQLEEELEKDQNNQTLVDELKETIEAEQDAISSAKKLKDSIVDVTENGYKKQIDYIKDLIDDYEELLEAQKDQIDYAKKVADQQKEINKLEKQYRAIQNDTSEEGATKRQKLQAQIKEKKEALQETQEDRRISETKDMLSKFEENFEDFLNNKLKDIETTVKNGIDIANNNIDAVKNTIDDLAKSNGYTISDTLKNSLTNIKDTLVGYFENGYSSEIANNTSTIVEGVNTIVDYYNKAQGVSEEKAEAERISTKIRETGTHVQSYKNEKGQTVNGYFKDDGTLNTKFNGWVNNKTNYYKNGQQVTNAWQTIDGKKYYFNKSGTKVTGSKTIGGKKYYFDKDGTMLTGWRKVGGKLHYYNPYMYTGKQTIGGQKYTFDDKGVFVKKGWKKGTASVPSTGMAWTNEGRKAEAIIRKSDGAILTPLNKGDSVIPSSAMKNMYQALTNPEKYLKQYTAPDIKVIQTNNGNNNSSPANINMQFIANGVQDANKFVNDLMNNKKLEKWIQEVTLGQANGNNSFRKYSYAIR